MKNVANYALLWCKIVGLKIRRCKFFDKYHVCLRIAYLMLILIARRKQTNRFIHTAFSLQNVSKSLQITWGIFSLVGLAKQVFFTVPPSSPNRGNHPILQMAFRSLLFVSKVKKTYQRTQLGKIDPNDDRNKGAS